ncbi:hypothetical protein ACJX0J_039978, partial [Zea mays]
LCSKNPLIPGSDGISHAGHMWMSQLQLLLLPHKHMHGLKVFMHKIAMPLFLVYLLLFVNLDAISYYPITLKKVAHDEA